MKSLRSLVVLILVVAGGAILSHHLIEKNLLLFMIALLFGTLIYLFFYDKPINALSFYILLLPFAGTYLFNCKLLPVPGGKVIILLFFFMLLVCLLNIKKFNRLHPKVISFIVFIFFVEIVCHLRGLENLKSLSFFFGEPLEPLNFILSYLLKPFTFFFPFVMILLFCKNDEELRVLNKYLKLSVTIFAFSIFFYYLFFVGNKSSIDDVRYELSVFVGVHSNEFTRILTMTVLFFFVDLLHNPKSIKIIVPFIMLISVVMISYSRTAYLIIVLEIFLFLLLSGRKKYLPFLFFIFIFIALLVPTTIKERVSYGVNNDDISAGRVQNIWMPLINEYVNDPRKLFLGAGIGGIVLTQSFKRNLMLDVGHAHNMFLTFIVDNGIILLIVLLYLYYSIIKLIWIDTKNANVSLSKDYNISIIVIIVCYFVSGMTDQSLLPTYPNYILWVIMGIALINSNIAKDNNKIRY
ncbi:MAG: O-antigen ligase family protein [Candidatus Omnitrophica bacterium]|nr:O-antigen ligase family protein [Candidatus Omnitrophota bacterium]